METPRFFFHDVWPEVRDVVRVVEQAMAGAIPRAAEFHRAEGWSPKADPHFFSALVRRTAMQELKSLDPALEDEDNLGQAMSGLIVAVEGKRLDCRFTIRVWKAHEGDPPRMATARRQRFCSQERSSQERLVIGDAGDPARTCNLILLWDSDGADLTLLDIIRPWNTYKDEVLVDWRQPILGVTQEETGEPEEDLPYGQDERDARDAES